MVVYAPTRWGYQETGRLLRMRTSVRTVTYCANNNTISTTVRSAGPNRAENFFKSWSYIISRSSSRLFLSRFLWIDKSLVNCITVVMTSEIPLAQWNQMYRFMYEEKYQLDHILRKQLFPRNRPVRVSKCRTNRDKQAPMDGAKLIGKNVSCFYVPKWQDIG